MFEKLPHPSSHLPKFRPDEVVEVHTENPYAWLKSTVVSGAASILPDRPGKNWCLLALSSEGDEFDPGRGHRATEQTRITLRVVLTRSALRTLVADIGVRSIFYLATRSSVQKLLPDRPLNFNYD